MQLAYQRFSRSNHPEKSGLIENQSGLPVSTVPTSSSLKFLEPPPIASRPFRLLDRRAEFAGLERFGLPRGGWVLYFKDLYHTMLNMPWWRFLITFFCVYLSSYLLFALLYLSQPDTCVTSIEQFSHALWFSVQTAATIGYGGQLSPNPDCFGTNTLVTFQVICASLIDYCMMGLVFARFAAPMPRGRTIRFSSNAVLYRQEPSGLWCLSFRVANIRKHALLQPALELILVLPEEGSSRTMKYEPLKVEDMYTQLCNLRLGMAANLVTIISPDSPLYHLSLDDMERRGMEFLCFMSGIDPMTSNHIQTRHSYTAADVRMNERFSTIDVQSRHGRLGVDFSNFDATHIAAIATYRGDVHNGFLIPVGDGPYSTIASMATHMSELRTRTFSSLRSALSAGGQSAEAASTSQGSGNSPDAFGNVLKATGSLPLPLSSKRGQHPLSQEPSPSDGDTLIGLLNELHDTPELSMHLRLRVDAARKSLMTQPVSSVSLL